MNFTRWFLFVTGISMLALSFQGCSSRASNPLVSTPRTQGSTIITSLFSCSASGTAVSGSSTQIANLAVTLFNAASGPFNISIPGNVSVSTSATTYNFSSVVASAGTLVSVVDTSNSFSASCAISVATPSAQALTIAASATSAGLNIPITLTATSSDLINPLFSFNQVGTMNSSVTISVAGNKAYISSSVATSVTIGVTAIPSAGGASEYNQIVLTFTDTPSNLGIVQISASPSTSVSLGNSIILTAVANGMTNPVFQFQQIGSLNPNVILSASGNMATVSSNIPASVTIGVMASLPGSSSPQLYSQISLQFGGGLICQLSHSPANPIVGGQVVFYVSANKLGRAVVTDWDPGEPWGGSAPMFPLLAPLRGAYSSVGVKNVRVWAQINGELCNAGAALQDSLTVAAAPVPTPSKLKLDNAMVSLQSFPNATSCPAGMVAQFIATNCAGPWSVNKFWLYCASFVNVADAVAEAKSVYTGFAVTPLGLHANHTPSELIPAGYVSVGGTSDQTGGTCSGIQIFSAKPVNTSSMALGDKYLTGVYVGLIPAPGFNPTPVGQISNGDPRGNNNIPLNVYISTGTVHQ